MWLRNEHPYLQPRGRCAAGISYVGDAVGAATDIIKYNLSAIPCRLLEPPPHVSKSQDTSYRRAMVTLVPPGISGLCILYACIGCPYEPNGTQQGDVMGL